MSGIGQWAMTVCVVAVICAVLEMLIPDKKYDRLLKPAIAAFAVYAVMFPLKGTFTDCAEGSGFIRQTEISTRLKEKVGSQAEDAVRNAVSAAVRSSLNGITAAEPEIDVMIETREDGSMVLSGVTVTASNADRQAESLIKSRAAASCGLDQSKITVKYE